MHHKDCDCGWRWRPESCGNRILLRGAGIQRTRWLWNDRRCPYACRRITHASAFEPKSPLVFASGSNILYFNISACTHSYARGSDVLASAPVRRGRSAFLSPSPSGGQNVQPAQLRRRCSRGTPFGTSDPQPFRSGARCVRLSQR